MGTGNSLREVLDYIQTIRFATLNYVREDKAPISRSMGSFALDGTSIIFSSQKDAAKVAAIQANRRISFFFEGDNQDLSAWKNVIAIGDAGLLEEKGEKSRIAEILAQRNPRFRERIEKGELDKVALFVLKTEEFQFQNRAKSPGNETIVVGN
jgi:nitroimidazol reductase NimA-like FMN-containing flavoprotein (pyridoxamine 5'-phosphate oxidase superfamily)